MNRPLAHRVLSFWLALLVLAASVGLSAERHRCRISGRSTTRLHLPLGHSGEKGGADQTAAGRGAARGCQSLRPAKRGDGCCDVTHAHVKLKAEAAGGAAKWLPAPPAELAPAVLPTATVWAGGAFAPAVLAPSVAVGTAANSSPPGPPRAGRVLLALVCTLVV